MQFNCRLIALLLTVHLALEHLGMSPSMIVCCVYIKQKIPVLCIVMKQITYINKLFTKTFIIKSVSCMAQKNFRSSGSLGHKRLLPPHLTERSLLHLTLPLTHSLPHPHYTSFPHPEQFWIYHWQGCQNKPATSAFHRLFWILRQLLWMFVVQFWAWYWRNEMEVAAYFLDGTSYSKTYGQPCTEYVGKFSLSQTK